jgi:type IV secretory pathway VirB10-like protein
MPLIENENQDEPENQESRTIQTVKKSWLNKNIFVGLLVLAFIWVLLNMGGDNDGKKVLNKNEDYLDAKEETTYFSQYIEKPVKQKIEEVEKETYHEEKKEKKPIIYEEFSNKYKRTKTQEDKTINGNNQRRNDSRSSVINPAGNFDRAALMKEVMSGVNSIGKEEPEPSLNEKLKIETLDDSFAYLEKDLDMKILPGRLIMAVLEFSIHSSLSGKVRAIISNDVYSEDGRRVIFPGGSRLVGQYAGGMEFGINRLFVIWETVITKTGQVINIGSPSLGPLGRSGVHMFIDTHFWDRFGSSLMLSVINGAVSIAGGFATEGSAQTVQDVQANLNKSSEMALEQALKIKPTGHSHHGSEIVVFISRKLDFTNIYKMEEE